MKKMIAVVVTLLFVLVGCGGSSSGDGVITIWTWDPAYNIDMMNRAADLYHEANPDVEIEIVETSNLDINEALHTAFTSKTVAGLPDIVLMEDYDAPMFLNSYPDAFYPLDDIVNYDDYLDYKVADCTLEDKHYCMPFATGVTGLFYREDYITEAGFTDEEMQDLTWSEFFDIAQKVYDKTGKHMLSIQISDVMYIRVMLQQAGTWYDDTTYDDWADNPVLREALENFATIANADWSKKVIDWNELIDSYNSGETGGVINGMWMIPSLKLNEDQSGLWRVTNTPKLDKNDSVNVSNSGGSSWYIINGTGDEELAADFLNSTHTDMKFNADNMLNNYALCSYIPAYTDPVFDREDEFFGGQQVNKFFADNIENIPPVTYSADFTSLQVPLQAEMQAYVDGKETLDEALANAKAASEQ